MPNSHLTIALLLLAASAAAQSKSCTPVPYTPPPTAEALAAAPPSPATTAATVRALLAQRKLDDALTTIKSATAAAPNDPLLQDVLGEVRFRRGEVAEAGAAYNRSADLDPCAPTTHYDAYRFLLLEGLYASAQSELDLAHKLGPGDPIINRVWSNSQRVPPTPAQQLEQLQKAAARPDLTPERKTALDNSIAALQARQRGDCQLVNHLESARIPLTPLGNATVQTTHGSGVDILFNGKRRRLKLDTGAGGILLSQDAAKALGLIQEAQVETRGFGDEGAAPTYLSHVDSIKIGPMEFHNCLVRVLENNNLHNEDGLLGGDVFSSFLLTLDFPSFEMRIDPLPKRPGEDQQTATLTANESDTPNRENTKTLAQLRRDRYIAPQMQSWTRVFRSSHFLILPTSIGNAPVKLFAMDTGSSADLISIAAAAEVSRISYNGGQSLHGLSGAAKTTHTTGQINLAFGGIRAPNMGLTSVDMASFTRNAGFELSGFLGYATLRELTIQIDYRDNLVHLTYIPHIDHPLPPT